MNERHTIHHAAATTYWMEFVFEEEKTEKIENIVEGRMNRKSEYKPEDRER